MWGRILGLAGVDRAIGWSAAPRIWSFLFAPLLLALIATRLTREEQGYYYTFSSVAALQVLFELGLSSVILHFAAHELASEQKGRLAALLRKSMRWYTMAACLLALTLVLGGTIFFASRPDGADWPAPWLALAIVTAGALALTPMLAVWEGCGAVERVARIRTEQAVAGNLAGCAVLLGGGRLWAPAAAGAAMILVVLLRLDRRFFRDLLRVPEGELAWREEIWPQQWRTALTWASNYFLLQSFTPLLFLFAGPAAAGQMGMSLAIANAIFNIALVWLLTKRPAFAMHAARREFDQLDAAFVPAMKRAVAVMLAGSVAFIAVAAILDHPRLLPLRPLILLNAAMLAMLILWAEATYLRAFKQEALHGIRVASAALVVTGICILGPRWGATGMMLGFFAVNAIVGLGLGTLEFRRERSRVAGRGSQGSGSPAT